MSSNHELRDLAAHRANKPVVSCSRENPCDVCRATRYYEAQAAQATHAATATPLPFTRAQWDAMNRASYVYQHEAQQRHEAATYNAVTKSPTVADLLRSTAQALQRINERRNNTVVRQSPFAR